MDIRFHDQRAVTNSYGTDEGSIQFTDVQVSAEDEHLPANKQTRMKGG